MKLRAYSEEEKTVELPIYIRAIDEGESVKIIVCDEKGKLLPSGCLCNITPEGIMRQSDISHGFGFSLNKRGELKIVGEE